MTKSLLWSRTLTRTLRFDNKMSIEEHCAALLSFSGTESQVDVIIEHFLETQTAVNLDILGN